MARSVSQTIGLPPLVQPKISQQLFDGLSLNCGPIYGPERIRPPDHWLAFLLFSEMSQLLCLYRSLWRDS